MAERRQAARREPIEIEVEDGREFIARPLPWMQANDLGNEIIRQNTESANEFVKMWVNDVGLPELQMQFSQKIKDWHTVLKLAFPEVTEEQWTKPRVLDAGECAELVLASLDVNHLEQIKHLVDPNSPALTNLGGTDTSPETEGNGQKTPSTPDSESAGSPVPTPSS